MSGGGEDESRGGASADVVVFSLRERPNEGSMSMRNATGVGGGRRDGSPERETSRLYESSCARRSQGSGANSAQRLCEINPHSSQSTACRLTYSWQSLHSTAAVESVPLAHCAVNVPLLKVLFTNEWGRAGMRGAVVGSAES